MGGDHTSGAQVLPADASLGAQWTDALHAWYSAWRALSSCVESLLILLPPGAAQVRWPCERLGLTLVGEGRDGRGQGRQKPCDVFTQRRILDGSWTVHVHCSPLDIGQSP